MRAIDADALISEIKKETEKAIEQDDRVGSFWLGYIAGLVIKQPTAQPSTSDLISRQAAIDALDFEIVHITAYCDGKNEGNPLAQYNKGLEDGKKAIEALPPAQPEPKEGHWIKHESPDGGEQYECSRCGVLWEFTDGTPEDNEAYFCPKCGAKMKGERQK